MGLGQKKKRGDTPDFDFPALFVPPPPILKTQTTGKGETNCLSFPEVSLALVLIGDLRNLPGEESRGVSLENGNVSSIQPYPGPFVSLAYHKAPSEGLE